MPPPSNVQPIHPPLTLVQKIDLYGELKRRVDLVAPDADRLAVLKDEIQAAHADADADKPVVARGTVYEIQLSPRRRERTVLNKKKVFGLLKKALGLDGIVALLEIPFGAAIDKYIPESQQKGLIHQERSGARTFNCVALAPAVERPPEAA